MKNKFLNYFTVVSLFVLLAVGAQAQNEQAIITKAMDDMKSQGWDVGSEYEATIKQGTPWLQDRSCYSNLDYRIMAFPMESGVQDMTIYIQDNYGSQLAASKSAKNPTLDYVFSADSDVKIKVTNNKSATNTRAYDVKVIVFYRSSYSTTDNNTNVSTSSSGSFPSAGNGNGQGEVDRIKTAMEGMDYTLGDEYDCRIAQGEYYYQYRYFYQGNYYAIYAVPMEAGVSDLDIILSDSDGNELMRDAASESISMVDYGFPADAEYKIRVKNTSASTQRGYSVKILVFYGSKPGSNISSNNSSSTSGFGQTAVDDIKAKMETMGYDLGSEYDCKVAYNEYWTQYRQCYTNLDYKVYAVPMDGSVYDLGIMVADNSGYSLAEDYDTNPISESNFVISTDQEVKLKITNVSSADYAPHEVKVLVFYGTGNSSNGGNLNAIYGSAAVDNIKTEMTNQGYAVGDEYTSNLRQGAQWSMNRTFYDGNDYMIYAVPQQSGVNDMTIELVDDDGSELYSESEYGSTAYMNYSFYRTRECKMVVKNSSSSSSSTSYPVSILVFYKARSDDDNSGGKTVDYSTSPGYGQIEVDKQKDLMAQQGWDVGSEYDFKVRKGDYKYEYRQFYDGNSYLVMAIPMEDGIKDLNVAIIDDDGSELIKDKTATPTAQVEYQFKSTRECKVKATLQNSAAGNKDYNIKMLVFYK